MKLVRISLIALSLGMFLTSCGGSSTETTTTTDSTTVMEAPATMPADTMAPAAPMAGDTMMAPATTDTMAR